MNKNNCKKVYFFDLDDTLVRTTKFNEAAVKHSLKVLNQFKINISMSSAWDFYQSVYQEIKANSNMMNLYFRRLVNTHSELFLDEDIAGRMSNVGVCLYEEFFEQNIKDYIPKDTIKCLERICEQGHEIGIISQGKPDFQKIKFQNMGIERFFNKNLRFYFAKKSVKNYEDVFSHVSAIYPNAELIMVGDREDIDILRPFSLGFEVTRIVGDGKYKDIKTNSEYEEYNNFTEFYKSLN